GTFSITFAQDIKESLFKEVTARFEEARKSSVNLMAPSFFTDALESFTDAKEDFKDGASLSGIKEQIAEANLSLNKAFKTAEVGNVTFAHTLKARTDALKISSEENVHELWMKAENRLKEAGEDLEDGDVNDAREGAKEAEDLFRTAELEAIKIAYLVETRNKIKEAEDKDVVENASKTLLLSKQLVTDCERELNDNRYDTDLPRSLAKQAQYEINHAFYLDKVITEFNEKDQTIESLILASELEVGKIASLVNVEQSFDNGLAPISNQIVEKVVDLKDKNVKLSNEILSLQKEIEFLKEELSGLSAEKSELASKMEKLDQIKQKYASVESLFSGGEAKVLREENNIIIRLVGLSFDVGKAVINPESFGLLTKLQKAIKEFPDSRVGVEGHTDSFGSDKKNLELSQQRADAVTQYLLANMDIDRTKITSIGYGETKPIANNETKEGRAINRRIDLKLNID
ncbi:MAG: OmpA family protein, partial [Ignavibacteriae bacterium]|nr:OmpA family protein [Ignavibacteriota bacterium]